MVVQAPSKRAVPGGHPRAPELVHSFSSFVQKQLHATKLASALQPHGHSTEAAPENYLPDWKKLKQISELSLSRMSRCFVLFIPAVHCGALKPEMNLWTRIILLMYK